MEWRGVELATSLNLPIKLAVCAKDCNFVANQQLQQAALEMGEQAELNYNFYAADRCSLLPAPAAPTCMYTTMAASRRSDMFFHKYLFFRSLIRFLP